MADVKLSAYVRSVLERSTITADLLILPDEQLERKFYEEVAKAINAAGGKWNRSKKGFLFQQDARVALGLALETGKVVDKKKARQAFYTPAEVAEEVADWACVSNKVILEPSAGDGALAKACIAAGAFRVDCIEIDAQECEKLKKLPRAAFDDAKDTNVECADFLKIPAGRDKYARIVMNPPFTRGTDVKHVKHALTFLRPGGKLVAIVAGNTFPKLSPLGFELIKDYPEGTFKESGTNVRTSLVCYDKDID